MGRAPSCEKEYVKKGPWTPEEDEKLVDYIQRHGHGCWRSLPQRAGLLRCGKSCRLRWTNYLRPGIKRGMFSLDEEQTIIQLHGDMGNKWSAIASHLPGRTDNEIKNYWNTRLRKRLLESGIDPVTHRPRMDLFDFTSMNHSLGSAALRHMSAMLEDAVSREYLKIVVATMMQQQVQQHNPNAGTINSPDLLIRSLLQNSFSRPDFIRDSIMPHISALTTGNQLGHLDCSALESQYFQELQSQAQLTRDMHHSSSINPQHILHVEREQHANNITRQLLTPMSDKSNPIADQRLNANEVYNNMPNEVSLLLQQHSEGQDINLPMPWGTSTLWLEENLIGFSERDSESLPALASTLWPEENRIGFSGSDSESLPALNSSASSQNMFNHSGLIHSASSYTLNVDMSSTGSTSRTTNNESYASASDVILDTSGNSKYQE